MSYELVPVEEETFPDGDSVMWYFDLLKGTDGKAVLQVKKKAVVVKPVNGKVNRYKEETENLYHFDTLTEAVSALQQIVGDIALNVGSSEKVN